MLSSLKVAALLDRRSKILVVFDSIDFSPSKSKHYLLLQYHSTFFFFGANHCKLVLKGRFIAKLEHLKE